MTQFELNGKTVAVDATPDTPVLWCFAITSA